MRMQTKYAMKILKLQWDRFWFSFLFSQFYPYVALERCCIFFALDLMRQLNFFVASIEVVQLQLMTAAVTFNPKESEG